MDGGSRQNSQGVAGRLMKESMQNTSMPNQEEFAAADADRMLLLEALSAWMDGEALPAGVDEHAVLQWLLQDTHAQETWRSWHAHADCLRARAFVTDAIDASRAARQKHDAAVGSVAWSESLRQRLAQTPVGGSEATAASESFMHESPTHEWHMQSDEAAVAKTATPVSVPADAGKPAVVAAAEAANDPVWRWKMTAGFASLAAVGVMAWSLLGQQPAAPGAAGALLATGGSTATAPAAAMPQQDVTVAGLQAQPDASALYPAEQSMRVSASADDGYATDSASYAEALMLAHSQLGENPLLQDALLTGQDE